MRKCDMCGADFKGKAYPVFNENWKKQKDLVSCGCHFPVPNETYDEYKKSGFSDVDIQQNANLINNQDL